MKGGKTGGPIPVLLMARELHLGGVERDVVKIAMNLDPARWTAHVATFVNGGLRYDELKAAGKPLLHVPLGSLASPSAIPAFRILWSYLRKHRIQVLHSYDASGIFGLAAAKAARTPVAITSQLSYRNILDARTQMLLRKTDPYADAVVVNCEAILRYMRDEEHVPEERIELCYNGVEMSEFHPAKEARPAELAGSSLVIGTVCALRPEKNLTLLQEAFARVTHRDGAIKLLIVGSGEERERLMANAERLGITERSVFVPATREVARWMRAIDVFVLPSYSEAFSNSLLEAMACGCSVVGSRVGGTPELTGENERGLLFESNDAAGLAERLDSLIGNPELRRGNAERAAAFVRERLTIEVAARRTAEIYEKLLRRKGKG